MEGRNTNARSATRVPTARWSDQRCGGYTYLTALRPLAPNTCDPLRPETDASDRTRLVLPEDALAVRPDPTRHETTAIARPA